MMVREGFLEGVGLEESRKKCQGMPARQKRLREIEPARLEARPGERLRAWLRGLCRQRGLVKSSHNLHSKQRSFLPWDAVPFGFGPLVPLYSQVLAQGGLT